MQKNDKPLAVIDTNLIISGLIFSESLPGRLLETWQKNSFDLAVSDNLLAEIKEVLKRDYFKKNYRLNEDTVALFITVFELTVELINPIPEENLPVHCRDPKDDMLLALSLTANEDFLITGDKDLLVLNGRKPLGKLKIVTVKDFLKII